MTFSRDCIQHVWHHSIDFWPFKQVYKFYNEGFYYFIIKLAVSQTLSEWVFAIFPNTCVCTKGKYHFPSNFWSTIPLKSFSHLLLQNPTDSFWLGDQGSGMVVSACAWSLSGAKDCCMVFCIPLCRQRLQGYKGPGRESSKRRTNEGVNRGGLEFWWE